MNGSMDCRLSLILSEHMIFESVEITNIHLGLLKAFLSFQNDPVIRIFNQGYVWNSNFESELYF